MWPFTKRDEEEPDTREPSEAAKAIAKSLVEEPGRWRLVRAGSGKSSTTLLTHDSGMEIDTWECWFNEPWLEDEPEANKEVIRAAIDKWIAARLAMPAPPKQEPANG